MRTGIAIFAHGSAVESANDAVRRVVDEFARSGGFDMVECSFLELGQPDLPAAVVKLVERGAERIVVAPYFITSGKHLKRDLPRIVEEIRAARPGLEISVTPPMDGHPGLASILVDRVRSAL